MNLTVPTKASMAFVRKRDALAKTLRCDLRKAGIRLHPRRSKAFEAGARADLRGAGE